MRFTILALVKTFSKKQKGGENMDNQKPEGLFVNRDLIKTKAKEQGMTMEDLAFTLNITRQGLWKKLNKDKTFTERELCGLFYLFGVSIFYLV